MNLNSLIAFLLCADPDGFIDFGNEHFAVADFAGLGGLDDGGDGALDTSVSQHHFEFDFGQEIDGVFAAAIDFGVALLAENPLTSVTVMPSIPISPSASFTSSNLNGFIMASTFFIGFGFWFH